MGVASAVLALEAFTSLDVTFVWGSLSSSPHTVSLCTSGISIMFSSALSISFLHISTSGYLVFFLSSTFSTSQVFQSRFLLPPHGLNFLLLGLYHPGISTFPPLFISWQFAVSLLIFTFHFRFCLGGPCLPWMAPCGLPPSIHPPQLPGGGVSDGRAVHGSLPPPYKPECVSMYFVWGFLLPHLCFMYILIRPIFHIFYPR